MILPNSEFTFMPFQLFLFISGLGLAFANIWQMSHRLVIYQVVHAAEISCVFLLLKINYGGMLQ